jgi:hypothetical protein
LFSELPPIRGFTYEPISGQNAPWIGWFRIGEDTRTLHLVRYPSAPEAGAGRTLHVEALNLPEDCITFGFVAYEERPWLFVMTRDDLLGIGLQAAVPGRTKYICRLHTPLALDEFMDRDVQRCRSAIDVNGDGHRDLLVLRPKALEIYLQANYLSFTYKGRVEPNHPLGWVGPYVPSSASLPYLRRYRREIWTEPALDSDLPNLIIDAYPSPATFKQSEVGQFQQIPTRGPTGNVTFRQVLKCRLNAAEPAGLLYNVVTRSGRSRRVTVSWSSAQETLRDLRLGECSCPPFATDVDRDGVTELFVLKEPTLDNALEQLIRSTSRAKKMEGRFVSWQPKRGYWAMHPEPLEMVMNPPDLYPALGFEQRLIIDYDFNRDGHGDIAWIGPHNKIMIALLRTKGGRIEAAKIIEEDVRLSVVSMEPVPNPRRPWDSILLHCEELRIRSSGRYQRGESYYLLQPGH